MRQKDTDFIGRILSSLPGPSRLRFGLLGRDSWALVAAASLIASGCSAGGNEMRSASSSIAAATDAAPTKRNANSIVYAQPATLSLRDKDDRSDITLVKYVKKSEPNAKAANGSEVGNAAQPIAARKLSRRQQKALESAIQTLQEGKEPIAAPAPFEAAAGYAEWNPAPVAKAAVHVEPMNDAAQSGFFQPVALFQSKEKESDSAETEQREEPTEKRGIFTLRALTSKGSKKPVEKKSKSRAKPVEHVVAKKSDMFDYQPLEAVGGARMDEVSVIPPMLPQIENLLFPTMMHHSSSVAIATPCELIEEATNEDDCGFVIRRATPLNTWVASVLLRKAAGPGKGAVHWRSATKGWAAFNDLTNGEYEVFYLSTPVRFTEVGAPDIGDAALAELKTPHRRIVIDLDHPADLSAIEPGAMPAVKVSRVDESDIVRTARMKVNSFDRRHERFEDTSNSSSGGRQLDLGIRNLVGIAETRADNGWKLLREGKLAAARKEFVAAVQLVGNGVAATDWKGSNAEPSTAELFGWREILEVSEPVMQALRKSRVDGKMLAREMARSAGDQKAMARTYYGLAKTCDAIGQSSAAVDPQAWYGAIIAYYTAMQLDDSMPEVCNDLGVLYYRLGDLKRGGELIEDAAKADPDPRYAYNMGRILWDSSRRLEARDWWHKAAAAEPKSSEAVLSLARFQLSGVGGALSSADCQVLAENLGCILKEYGPLSSQGKWAKTVLQQLEVLGYEIRLNSTSLAVRTFVARSASSYVDDDRSIVEHAPARNQEEGWSAATRNGWKKIEDKSRIQLVKNPWRSRTDPNPIQQTDHAVPRSEPDQNGWRQRDR